MLAGGSGKKRQYSTRRAGASLDSAPSISVRVCITAQTRSPTSGMIISTPANRTASTQTMLISGFLIALTAAVIITRVGTSDGMNAGQLGWMSEQWLAEHRASNPS